MLQFLLTLYISQLSSSWNCILAVANIYARFKDSLILSFVKSFLLLYFRRLKFLCFNCNVFTSVSSNTVDLFLKLSSICANSQYADWNRQSVCQRNIPESRLLPKGWHVRGKLSKERKKAAERLNEYKYSLSTDRIA